MTPLRGASVRLLHNPDRAALEALFAALVARGCTAVALIPHHYAHVVGAAWVPPADLLLPDGIYPDVGQDPTHPFHNTPDPAVTYMAIRLAQRAGLHVLLKPHVDSYQAAWRGYISVAGRERAWATAYKRFLRPYVDLARRLHTDLCLGCELYTVTKDLGAAFWISVADWARRTGGFRGALTYAANWGWEADAEYNRLADLWPHLDYVGVDAYFPLVPEGYGPPDAQAAALRDHTDPDHVGWHRRGLDAPWCPRIDDDLLSIAQRTGKPLLFTEIGYPNSATALTAPGADPAPDAVPTPTLQTAALAAFAARWRDTPALAGWYWWEAWLERPAPPVSHDILDQPAAALVWGA